MRTTLQANIAPIAERIASVVSAPPRIWLLRSQVTTVMDVGASQAFDSAFEALAFLGVKVNIVDEERLQAADGLVVVPATSFVSNETVRRLAMRPAGRLAVVEPAVGARTLRYSHDGLYRRRDSELAFLRRAAVVPLTDARTMLPQLASAASAAGIAPELRCVEGRAIAPGVLCRLAGDTVFVLNLRNTTATVRLELRERGPTPRSWTDLLSGRPLAADPAAGLELPLRTARVLQYH